MLGFILNLSFAVACGVSAFALGQMVAGEIPRWRQHLTAVRLGHRGRSSPEGMSSLAARRFEELIRQVGYPFGWPAEWWEVLSWVMAALMGAAGLLSTYVVVAGGAALIGYALPPVGLRIAGKLRRQRLIRDSLRLVQGLEMYLEGGYSLYDALRHSAAFCPTLRGPMTQCLLAWGDGPGKALRELGKRVDLMELDLLLGALQQAHDHEPRQLLGYLRQEAGQIQRLWEAYTESRAALRPYYLTVYLGLPAYALYQIVLGPIGYSLVLRILQW